MTTKCMMTFNDEALDDSAEVAFFLAGVVTDPEAGAVTALQAALEGFCGAAIHAVALQPVDNTIIGIPENGPYGAIEDKMRLFFKSATGQKIQVSVPAPTAAAFLPNKDAVDSTQADVNALIVLLQTNMKGTDGSAVTFVRGRRVRTKRHKPS